MKIITKRSLQKSKGKMQSIWYVAHLCTYHQQSSVIP